MPSPDYLAEFRALSESRYSRPIAPKGANSLPGGGEPDLLAPKDLLAQGQENQTGLECPDWQADDPPAPGPAALRQMPLDPPAGPGRAEFWAAGVARLDPARVPTGFPAVAWAAAVESARGLSAESGQQLAALGWDSARIWGAHHAAPFRRLDCAGLCLLLPGRWVLAVKAEYVAIESSGGARQILRILPPSSLTETVLLWQLQPRGSAS
jgi:hypothetical protein